MLWSQLSSGSATASGQAIRATGKSYTLNLMLLTQLIHHCKVRRTCRTPRLAARKVSSVYIEQQHSWPPPHGARSVTREPACWGGTVVVPELETVVNFCIPDASHSQQPPVKWIHSTAAGAVSVTALLEQQRCACPVGSSGSSSCRSLPNRGLLG
ncbi:hypothetical protein ElyMa_001648900 [Elysia marginata]|uniref:Ig-like domain-containing protein n=1 Tax=Elysia marginata TaxID=1093978 RepID=A0AAV4JM18_9GAST|nr:hypothetical protein ElyMa_001648900 [Elysia marginata]